MNVCEYCGHEGYDVLLEIEFGTMICDSCWEDGTWHP